MGQIKLNLRAAGRVASLTALLAQPLARSRMRPRSATFVATPHQLPWSRGKPSSACWTVPGRKKLQYEAAAHRGL